MDKFSLTQVFIGVSSGVVEVTSTDSALLKNISQYLTQDLSISSNKVTIKQIRNKVYNITIISLDATNIFSTYWALLEYMCSNSWEPFNVLGDSTFFKINTPICLDSGSSISKERSQTPERLSEAAVQSEDSNEEA